MDIELIWMDFGIAFDYISIEYDSFLLDFVLMFVGFGPISIFDRVFYEYKAPVVTASCFYSLIFDLIDFQIS